MPYCYLNRQQQLVGLDVELMHKLAARLQVRLEFVPYEYDSLDDQLEHGDIDLALGGLLMNPERSIRVGFTQPYATATAAVVLPDHRRGEFESWDDSDMPSDMKLSRRIRRLGSGCAASVTQREAYRYRFVRKILHRGARPEHGFADRSRGGGRVEHSVS